MSALVIGLVVGIVVGAILIVCGVRNICKESTAVKRHVKQVQQIEEDQCFDVEAPTPPSDKGNYGTATTDIVSNPKKAAGSSPPAPTHVAPPSRGPH
ncbi:unnamed protein product [Pylaiella littoralis]